MLFLKEIWARCPETMNLERRDAVPKPKCTTCNDTGAIETGNNDMPCDCPAGATALFSQAGVKGPVTGAEIRRHFQNDSPEPIETGKELILASSLPGRKKDAGCAGPQQQL